MNDKLFEFRLSTDRLFRSFPPYFMIGDEEIIHHSASELLREAKAWMGRALKYNNIRPTAGVATKLISVPELNFDNQLDIVVTYKIEVERLIEKFIEFICSDEVTGLSRPSLLAAETAWRKLEEASIELGFVLEAIGDS